MGLGDDVGGHEADIVPLQRILRAGIAEADPDLHCGSLAGAPANKNRSPCEASGYLRSEAGEGEGLIAAASPRSLAFLGFAFLALDGRDRVRRRSLFLFRLHRRRRDDRGDGEVLVGVCRDRLPQAA